jgi:Tol biopolymer transport system component
MLAIAGILLALILATLLAAGGRPFGPPTNGRIVFGRYDSVQKDTVLYMVNPDGTHLLKLRSETHECPYWSPDSKRITTTDAVMNGDGTGSTRFAIPERPVFGRLRRVVARRQAHRGRGLERNDASQTALQLRSQWQATRQITDLALGHDIPSAFAPDGSSIAFTRDGQAGSAATLSGRRRWLPRAAVGNLPIDGADWLPMGDPSSPRVAGHCSAWMATGWATPHGIVETRPPSLNPQWSPDGTRILFRMKVNNEFDFYTMRPDGTDVFQLTNEPEDDYFADWGRYPLD